MIDTENNNANEVTATSEYRGRTAEQPAPEIVDVTVPSGFVFKFRKPSAFSMLFTMGELPVAAANAAAEAWREAGVVDPASQASAPLAAPAQKMAEIAFRIRDRVLELSYDPKLVVGAARSARELSTEDLSDVDLEYLFKWVSAGGNASAMLAMFPAGSRKDSLASANRPKRGRATEPSGKN